VTDKIKILYLMAGHPAIFGGGKRVFLQIMRHLNKDDFQFNTGCALNREQEAFVGKLGGQIINIDIQHGGIWTSMKILKKIILDENIDIIHSQGARADFYSRLVSKLIKKPPKIVNTIAMLVKGYDVEFFKKTVYSGLDRFTEKYADKFIVVSNALRDELINNHSIPYQKIITIYNGIELNEYQAQVFTQSARKIRKEFDIDNEEFIIGAIGRIVWQKGFEYFIRSIPKMLSSIPKARIVLVGDGPLTNDLKSLSLKLGVRDKVIFTGFRSDIREILSAIDLLVIPSLVEGFPMITLEAMAMEKPVIATNIDGISEQIRDGKTGILVPAKDSDFLARATVSLLNDRETARRIGLAAKKEVEKKYSVEKMVRQTEKVYWSLMRDN
jgi:glycosyltransferase involved in cell wall biosynthesis